MKIKLLLFALLAISSLTVSASLDTNLVKKRWKIIKYSKKSKVIPHKEDDFLQFGAKGAFEEVLEGMYVKGIWSFNPTTNVLTIKIPDHNFEWTVSELTAKTLKATHNHEVLELEAVPLKQCVGDPYENHTIICGKWRVSDHKAHYNRVAYKPGDYVRFFSDGTVEEVFQGVYKKMKWNLDEENAKLSIGDVIWEVKDIKQKKFNGERKAKNETIEMVKLADF